MVVSSHARFSLASKDEIKEIIVPVDDCCPDQIENHKMRHIEVEFCVVPIINTSYYVKFINLPQFKDENEY